MNHIRPRCHKQLDMEDTTTFDVSPATVPKSNHHPSPSATPERSFDTTRSSQTSLCNVCAHGLILDDGRAGGALEEARNDGAPNLRFPFLGGKDKVGWSVSKGDHFVWIGGAQYEPRDITPPHLPELSDECKFCRIVKSILLDQLSQRKWWQTTTKKLTLEVQYEWSGSKKEGCQLDFNLSSLRVFPNHHNLLGYYSIRFPIATSSESCQEWLHVTGRHLDVKSSFSERNVNLIRSWLEQCNTDPSCCHSAKQEGFLPTRLMDVGVQGSNDLPITLVDTRSIAQLEDEDRPLKYICLSYCWGAVEPPLKTTRSTIEGYKKGIHMDSMPRVFRDAVLVARTLGIRYLWIDALCIIQDCHGDWHNESAAMADVFSHSWMTIGAATTSSCHETLFHPRQDLSIDIEFQSSIKRNITGTISILLLSDYFDSPLDATLNNSTWNTRGWVWQEQKLPQRLLIFGEKMLHFRCHQRLLHEFGRHYGAAMPENPKVSLEGPGDWTAIMNFYSHRELSRGSDRLAAISGFVKAVAQELKDAEKSATYIAGIWLAENAFVDLQLSWFVENPTISFGQLLLYHSDPQQYIAPSWSWASLNQPLNTHYGGTWPVFQVIAHNIEPARSDPTVAIAPGSSITLFGKHRKIPGRPSMGLKFWRSSPPKTWWEAPYSGVVKTWPWMEEREEEVVGRIKYFLDWDPSTQNATEHHLETCLEIFLLSETLDQTMFGLILFPVVADAGLFLRVGCFEINGQWESPDWHETEVIVI